MAKRSKSSTTTDLPPIAFKRDNDGNVEFAVVPAGGGVRVDVFSGKKPYIAYLWTKEEAMEVARLLSAAALQP